MLTNHDKRGGGGRAVRVARSLATVLLLSVCPAALHAEERDLQKEFDLLKAQINEQHQQMIAQKEQINSLRSALGVQRAEAHHTQEKIKVIADRSYAPPLPAAANAGFQPIGGFDDKKFHLGGITLTPGGYIAAEGVFRSKTTQSDIASNYGGTPTNNLQQAHTNELRFSARQSRFALLAEGDISPSILASGYLEGDFQGSGSNSNSNQGNGYVPRVRNLYANIDFLDSGFHLLAGQSWSLLTLNSKGITPRNEVSPPSIDAQPLPGFYYARQPQIRITKDFDKKLWLSVSAEASQTTIGGSTTCAAGNGATAVGSAAVTCNLVGTGTGFGGNGVAQNYSLNHIPDVVGKIAYEARIADRDVHIEGLGLYRNFYDRVNYGTVAIPAASGGGTTYLASGNKSTNGFAFGGGLVAAVVPKRLDFQIQGLVGSGIGRYGSAGFASDTTISGDGSLKPLRGSDLLAGLTFHATPEIDAYLFSGFEQIEASTSRTSAGTLIGYGVPTANDGGCEIEGGVCAGNTHRVWHVTGGLWDKIYQGRFGYFRAGIQYTYLKKELFNGASTAAGTGFVNAPKTDDHLILTSLRFYPF